VTIVWVLVAIAVLGAVAVVAAGRGEGLSPAEPDRPDVAIPPGRPVGKDDIDRLRFSVGLRGYRMDEVDDVLDRLAADIAARDELIEHLEREAHGAADAEPSAAEAPESPAEEDADLPAGRTMFVPVHDLDSERDAAPGSSPDEPPR
jgi:DivIVA domain-containing protein